MQYDEFVDRVQREGGLASRAEAERAIRATFETLAERLTAGEAHDLAAQLPKELAFYFRPEQARERLALSVDEFFQRVSWRESSDAITARQHARSVLAVLREAVTPDAVANAWMQLPTEYDALFTGGSEGSPPTAPNR